nr:ribonuclease H-like domain-containing protein [Tanacetum cinerariifolium]
MAQHTPVQLQFSHAAVSHQATKVSDQHAPVIIQNPPVNPNPNSVHPMVTCFRVGTNRPTKRLNIHVSSISPLPKSYRDAFNDPNWQNAILDEYTALVKNKTWTLVPRPPNTDIVRCMWLFHHKYLADGMLSFYKVCLMENGSTQLERVDLDEKFSLVLNQGIDTAYLLLYVDDIVLNASSEGLLQRIIGSLHQEFAMTYLGPLNYFLGIFVTRDSSGLFLSHKKYAIEILEKEHMVSCNPSRNPVDTESKLGVDGHPISDPTLFVYICMILKSLISLLLRGFCGMFRTGCPTTQRSTLGYCVFLGNNLLSWSAKHQPTLSRSSVEAEYHGVANAVAETCWLRNLLRELHTPLSSATMVYCDNVSVVYLSSNPVQHQRISHIEIDIHFVRDLVAAGQVRVLHVPSRYQFADLFV